MSEETAVDKLKEISDAMDIAKPYGLECEVIMSSMNYLKEHPEASIKEATDYGVGEWVK